MLRAAMRELYQVLCHAVAPADKVAAAHVLSLVGERLATMLLAQKKLGGDRQSEFSRAVDEALRQVAEELNLQ